MKTLLLLRHAKSDWKSDAWEEDFDRPLSERGRRNAGTMARYLAGSRYWPDLVLCSSAVRTKQTLDIVLANDQNVKTDILYKNSLYLADANFTLGLIKAQSEKVGTLMIAGHNHGLEDLLLMLSRQTPPRTRKGKLLTTSAIAILETELPWKKIEKGSMDLVDLVRPKKLEKEAG